MVLRNVRRKKDMEMQAVASSLSFSKDSISDLCRLGAEGEQKGQIIIPIGLQDNSLIMENFAPIPSSLITGTTGSGKSAFVKTLIAELMEKYTPEHVRFAIFDSRGVDYGFLNTNPFMLLPVMNDVSKATSLIQWALLEARKRMNMLDRIDDFAHLFLIFDDFGELSPSNDTFSDLVQLLQIARRTKLHVWIVTSTPSSNVLPTDLKANINHRMAFHAASKSISRIVIDDAGAESLNVPGEIIAKLNNTSMKCDAVYLDEVVVEELCKNALTKYPTLPNSDIVATNSPGEEKKTGLDVFLGEDGKDILFKEAVDVVLDSNQASVSMLQRRLKLGYSRAARLMDQMEVAGIVGPFEGSRPRVILITKNQWQAEQGSFSTIPNEAQKVESSINNAVTEAQYSIGTLTEQSISLVSGYVVYTLNGNVIVKNAGYETSISGTNILELMFKRPSLFRKGKLSISFIPSESEEDRVKPIKKTMEIPVDAKDTGRIKEFCKRLAADIKKPVVEL